jgi:uncharacterized damage-inducible protein DinB
MSEIKRIGDQLRRAYEGEAWHGPSLQELLAGLTAEQAMARPLAGRHTIAELVLHVAAWTRIAARRLAGDTVKPAPGDDWPPVPGQDEAAWTKVKEDLKAAQQQLQAAVTEFPEARLNEKLPGEKYSAYFLVHGVIQHDLYHAGQIALLRKGK